MKYLKPDSFKKYRQKAWLEENNPEWKGNNVGYSGLHLVV